jgi:hypothetical protein
MHDQSLQRPYFFDAGIAFSCAQCGACCTGEPGAVHVTTDEVAAIAAALGMSPEEFGRAHLAALRGRFTIREHADGRCHFYDGGCTIYPVRPRQCRTFPFWISTMRSERAWQETSRQCPGIGRGRRHSREEVLGALQQDLSHPLS